MFIKFTDFPLASTLVCLDHKLLFIENDKNDSKRLEFVFEKTEAIELLISGYWNNNLLVHVNPPWRQPGRCSEFMFCNQNMLSNVVVQLEQSKGLRLIRCGVSPAFFSW